MIQPHSLVTDFDGSVLAGAVWPGPRPDAPRLLLIPGTMGYLEEMAPFARAFAAHFAVLSFDHPGMKGSSPMVYATPERLARALEAMVEQAFGDAPVAIYGISLGAVVGALIARTRPSRVRALIFDDPVFAPADFAGIANYAAELVRGVPPDSPALTGFAEFTGFDPHTLKSDGRTHLHLLPEVAAPILVLAGSEGNCAFDAAAEGAARALRSDLLVERIAGGGHPVCATAADACAARTASFVSTAPAPATTDLVRPDEYALRLVDGTTAICVRDVNSTSTAVLLELEDWFEDEMAFVRTLVRPGWRAFDAGSNIGVYSLALAKGGAEVAAYEPNPPIADRGRRALALNGFAGRVRHNEAALGAIAGTAHFDASGMPENAHLAESGTVPVRVTTFDDELAALGWDDVDFIKMDLEGGEVEALRGASRLLADHSPLLMSEIAKADGSPNFAPLRELEKSGYAIYSLIPGLSLLAPFDEGNADAFQVYGFAAKPDRVAKLRAAGRLVEHVPAPDPLGDPAPWLALAVQRVRMIVDNPAFAAGMSHAREPGGGDLVAAIAHFERSRVGGRLPEARLGDLRAARAAAVRAYAARQSAPRALVLARVSRELGMRGAAGTALGDMMRLMSTGGQMVPDEPMVPALARHEAARARSPGDWFIATVAEGFAALCGFAAGFNLQGQQAGVWPFLEEVGLATPATERARQVQKMLSRQQAAPMPNRLLAEFGPGRLNPEIWRGG